MGGTSVQHSCWRRRLPTWGALPCVMMVLYSLESRAIWRIGILKFSTAPHGSRLVLAEQGIAAEGNQQGFS